MENNYLNFRKVSETETELYIYGPIRKKDIIEKWLGVGQDVTEAFTLKNALASVDTPNLTVRINSSGGSVSEALAIYSILSGFKGHLKTIVDGWACSAASVIFMAGEERVVPEQALLLIHNAWTEAKGDSNAMKKVAEDLEKITQPSINIYTSKTNLSEEEIKEKMNKEEWITSQEAYKWGFSTTQEIADNYNQSLEANLVYNLVMKNKKIQKENEDLQEKENKEIVSKIDNIVKEALEKTLNSTLEECYNNLLYGTGTEKPIGIRKKLKQNKINEDTWMSFFNTKNKEKEGKKNEN